MSGKGGPQRISSNLPHDLAGDVLGLHHDMPGLNAARLNSGIAIRHVLRQLSGGRKYSVHVELGIESGEGVCCGV